MVIFKSMFTPLNLNHYHNTCAAVDHLLDIPQKQTCHYGTYSMVFTASKIWNDTLRKYNKNLLYSGLCAFKKTMFQRFSASMKMITQLIRLYLLKLQLMVVNKIVHFLFFYQYSNVCSVCCISLSITISPFMFPFRCIYTYIHMCACVYIYIYIHTYLPVCVYVYVYVFFFLFFSNTFFPFCLFIY